MKFRVLLCLPFLLAFSGHAFAENFLIPTCDLRRGDATFASLTGEQLSAKANISIKRRDHCDAASALLEVNRRGLDPASKPALFENIFGSLKAGKFLNEYTALLMGLKTELAQLDIAKISEDHARLYLHFIGNEGTHPYSQFTVKGKPLLLIDEAEICFRLFILNFSSHPFAAELRKQLAKLHDQRIVEKIDYISFFRRRGIPPDLTTREFERLALVLSKSRDANRFMQGVAFLESLLSETTYSSELRSEIRGLIQTSSYDELFTRIRGQKRRGLVLEGGDTVARAGLEEFLRQKGDDRTVFLPINKDFKLTSTQTLVGLGVVGILIAFDEPIKQFIQRNKDAGTLDGLARFGNHFGDASGLGPLLLGTLGVGLVFDNHEAKNAAVSSIGAILLGQLAVETLKSATHRSRPEAGAGPFDFKGVGLGSDNSSFASGHSAAAWSVASVFAEEYGDEHKWVPFVAYAFAAVTSYARMHYNKHWASDVAMGAMIGYISGKLFHQFYRNTFKGRFENVRVSPIIGFGSGTQIGVQVEITERVYADLKTWPIDIAYDFQKTVIEMLGRDPAELERLYEEIYLESAS